MYNKNGKSEYMTTIVILVLIVIFCAQEANKPGDNIDL